MLDALVKAVPCLRYATDGDVYLLDKESHVIKGSTGTGNGVVDLPDELKGQIDSAGNSQDPREIVFSDGRKAWVIPLAGFRLVIARDDHLSLEKEMSAILKAALPLVAEVAGGEAVLFDHEGRRLESINPDGSVNTSRIGLISRHAREAMMTGRPVIGNSVSVPGAIAVRIPLTRKFGLGFNNELVAKQKHRLLEEVKKYQSARYNLNDIIGDSMAIRKAKALAARVARSSSRVIIYGETGTGKEVFAQAIHNASPRSSRPFVAVNCAVLPPSLAESILLGYTEGAYTGATKGGMAGVFEQANGGTLMLDEIGEMPLDLQAKLLRILEEGHVTRLGSTRAVPVDVRVIAATNRDLQRLMEERKFREDLYYRLQVMTLSIPPLRERKEDIPALVSHFISYYDSLFGISITRIDDEAMELLLNYEWPGNVRELRNAIEYASNIAESETLTVHDFPDSIVRRMMGEGKAQFRGKSALDSQKAEAERAMIVEALSMTGNNKGEAAKMLGISQSTLWRKMKKLNIS